MHESKFLIICSVHELTCHMLYFCGLNLAENLFFCERYYAIFFLLLKNRFFTLKAGRRIKVLMGLILVYMYSCSNQIMLVVRFRRNQPWLMFLFFFYILLAHGG